MTELCYDSKILQTINRFRSNENTFQPVSITSYKPSIEINFEKIDESNEENSFEFKSLTGNTQNEIPNKNISHLKKIMFLCISKIPISYQSIPSISNKLSYTMFSHP